MLNKTRILTTMAMLTGLSIILVLMVNFPILPAVPFMKYDPADVPILIGTFLFGPIAGLILTALVSVLQGVFISSDGGIIGIIMHFLATGSFVIVAGNIYHRTLTKTAALIALVAGVLAMTVVMVGCNLVLTPLFLGAPMEKVIELLLPAIIPFNLIKAGINAIIVWIIYKPVSILVHQNIKK